MQLQIKSSWMGISQFSHLRLSIASLLISNLISTEQIFRDWQKQTDKHLQGGNSTFGDVHGLQALSFLLTRIFNSEFNIMGVFKTGPLCLNAIELLRYFA